MRVSRHKKEQSEYLLEGAGIRIVEVVHLLRDVRGFGVHLPRLSLERFLQAVVAHEAAGRVTAGEHPIAELLLHFGRRLLVFDLNGRYVRKMD